MAGQSGGSSVPSWKSGGAITPLNDPGAFQVGPMGQPVPMGSGFTPPGGAGPTGLPQAPSGPLTPISGPTGLPTPINTGPAPGPTWVPQKPIDPLTPTPPNVGPINLGGWNPQQLLNSGLGGNSKF